MYDNKIFEKLCKSGSPTGEVVGVNGVLTKVKGLEGVPVNSLVMFESGTTGLVQSVKDQIVTVLSYATQEIPLGTVAALHSPVYQVGVGKALIGRVVNTMGQPIDGKGAVSVTAQAEVFVPAPSIVERQILSDQLVSGVTIVDSLFPVVLGQRIAVLGDNKSGKTTFMTQLTEYQAQLGRIIVYVMVAKRQVDIDRVVARLRESGALERTIVVVASSFDSLAQAYLAPYVGCAMAEHLWRNGQDTIIIYDDLSNHAKIYRELSLLSEANPGRDSYPGDMFYAHSSLLERAGKLLSNGATLTALPLVQTPNDDITSYLPTSVMSITDGQIIFDLKSFRQGIRPAVNVGLSVSRVGGSVQSAAWKDLSTFLFRKLADYRQAAEFAQFGSELALESQADLALGKLLYEVFKQPPHEVHDLATQYLSLQTVLISGGKATLNVALLKQKAKEMAAQVDPNSDASQLVQQLLKATSVQVHT